MWLEQKIGTDKKTKQAAYSNKLRIQILCSVNNKIKINSNFLSLNLVSWQWWRNASEFHHCYKNCKISVTDRTGYPCKEISSNAQHNPSIHGFPESAFTNTSQLPASYQIYNNVRLMEILHSMNNAIILYRSLLKNRKTLRCSSLGVSFVRVLFTVSYPFYSNSTEYKTQIMMTSSNGNTFRVTGPLWWEFTGDRWIPLTKASNAELWWFIGSEPEQTTE